MEVDVCSPASLTAVVGYMYGFSVPWHSADHGELIVLADLFQVDFIKAQAALKVARDGHFTEENCLLICQVFSLVHHIKMDYSSATNISGIGEAGRVGR